MRLREDLIALVAGALEPVPPDPAEMAARLEPPWEWQDTPQAEAAVAWHSAGFLHTGCLRVAPPVRCRRTSEPEVTVTLAWRHRPDPEGVIEFAGAQAGRVTAPTGEFVGAVADFNRALLAAMSRRVAELTFAGPPPGVALDLAQLHREHGNRAARLPRARTHPGATDWAAVRAGAGT